MVDGIIVKVLGDHGPFSRMGKSIGYQLTIGQSNYLIDCGAPLFQQISGHGLKNINGLVVTHCHDDHKRWFSDLALFNMYAADFAQLQRIILLTSEAVNEELMRASAPSLDRSLSVDSKSIVDIPYEEFVRFTMIGPHSKFKIVPVSDGRGGLSYRVVDKNGTTVDPDIAKTIINPKTYRCRMLFRDPDYKEWVEPESFYSFSSTVFYEKEQNIYKDKEGFSLQAIKAAVWHGVPAIGIKIRTDKETLIFSSDTVHDRELWTQLYTEKRVQKRTMSKKEFESMAVIYGDINDYIERVWSEERYRDATNEFNDAVVIHDVAGRRSIVHTDYEKLETSFLRKDRTLLTHSPDTMTSEWVLCNTGKTYKIKDGAFYEIVDGKELIIDADIYHREGGRYFVGYKNENGNYLIYEKDGLLGISSVGNTNKGKHYYRVDLYEDISGKYFPATLDKDTMLFERKDGKVEQVEFNEYGSMGKILEDCRNKHLKREKIKQKKHRWRCS
jgi:ribonuclease BN (tRNA processing enzyme)